MNLPHKNKHLVFISDLGHTGVIWPRILDGFASTGWKVTIVCPKLSKSQMKFFGLKYNDRTWKIFSSREFRSPYRKHAGFSKYQRFFFNILNFFAKSFSHEKNQDGYSSWRPVALALLESIYRMEKIDLILSSSSPFESHIIASEFGKIHNIKWIADYRDLWSLNHAADNISEINIEFEKRVLSTAMACITTSDGFSKTLSTIYPGPIFIIHNGFTGIFPAKPFKNRKRPKLLYPGQIYPNLQNIRPLLEALKIVREHNVVQPIFRVTGYAIKYIKELNVNLEIRNSNWIDYGKVNPLEKSLKMQRNSDFLIYLGCTNPKVTGWMQTKLYEYISSGVPILVIGPKTEDEATEILTRSGMAIFLYTVKDIIGFFENDINNLIKNLHRDDHYLIQFDRFSQGIEFSRNLQSFDF